MMRERLPVTSSRRVLALMEQRRRQGTMFFNLAVCPTTCADLYRSSLGLGLPFSCQQTVTSYIFNVAILSLISKDKKSFDAYLIAFRRSDCFLPVCLKFQFWACDFFFFFCLICFRGRKQNTTLNDLWLGTLKTSKAPSY